MPNDTMAKIDLSKLPVSVLVALVQEAYKSNTELGNEIKALSTEMYNTEEKLLAAAARVRELEGDTPTPLEVKRMHPEK